MLDSVRASPRRASSGLNLSEKRETSPAARNTRPARCRARREATRAVSETRAAARPRLRTSRASPVAHPSAVVLKSTTVRPPRCTGGGAPAPRKYSARLSFSSFSEVAVLSSPSKGPGSRDPPMSTKHAPPRFSPARRRRDVHEDRAVSRDDALRGAHRRAVVAHAPGAAHARPKTDTFSKTFLSVPSTSVSRMTGQTVSAGAGALARRASRPRPRCAAPPRARPARPPPPPRTQLGLHDAHVRAPRAADRHERYARGGGQRQVRVQGDSRRRREFHENHSAHPGAHRPRVLVRNLQHRGVRVVFERHHAERARRERHVRQRDFFRVLLAHREVVKRDDARRRRERVPLEYAAAGDLFPVTPTGIGGAARGDGEQALALDVRNLLRTRATFRRLRRVQCGDVDAVVGRRVCFLRGLGPRGFAARRTSPTPTRSRRLSRFSVPFRLGDGLGIGIGIGIPFVGPFSSFPGE